MPKLRNHRFSILDSRKNGQSLVEILVAVAVGAVLVIGAATAISPSLKTNTQAYRVQIGSAMAKELLENVRIWSEGDWHNVFNLATSSANHYYLNATSSPFAVVSGNESVVISTTTFTRYFYVDDVYRDASDLVVTAGGSYDPSTKKVSVDYSWPGVTTSTIAEFMTRNKTNIFWQTDWSGGSGQNGPVTSTNNMFSTSTKIDYATTTGSIVIKFQ